MRTTFYKFVLGDDCLTHYTCQNGHKSVITENSTSMSNLERGNSSETIFNNIKSIICPDCDDEVPTSLKDRALKELKLMAKDAVAAVILSDTAILLTEPVSAEIKAALIVGLVGMVYSEIFTSELLTGAAIGQVAAVIPMVSGVKSTLCSALQLGLMATGAVVAGNLYRKNIFRLFLQDVAEE